MQQSEKSTARSDAPAMVDRLMFAYSRSLTWSADNEQRIRANLGILEEQEQMRLREMLLGLDKLSKQQKIQADLAMQTIKSLDHRNTTSEHAWRKELELEKERTRKAESAWREELLREKERKREAENVWGEELSRMRTQCDALKDVSAAIKAENIELKRLVAKLGNSQEEAHVLSAKLADVLQALQQRSQQLVDCNETKRRLFDEKNELQLKVAALEQSQV